MIEHAYAVILAGGKGERFWPMSTARQPKQLLSLVGERSLLAQAVERLEGLVPPERVLVITSADLVAATRESVPEVPPEQIIGEPVGRDTAPAVALAAALVKQRDPEGVFCILTADHVMGDLEVFRDTLRDAMDLAFREDVLITIGIRPTEPSTGYGYIEAPEVFSRVNESTFRRARRFVEKPDGDTARKYLAEGNFYWNSGMFIWSVAALEKAFRAHCPALADMMDSLGPHVGKQSFEEQFKTTYETVTRISIDYALMEHAENIVMAEGVFAWDDVGSWTALSNHFPADEGGNVVVGAGELLGAEGNIVVSRDHLTAVVGVSDLVVVQAPGVTLVCPKDRVQDVKKMVQQLREAGTYDEVL